MDMQLQFTMPDDAGKPVEPLIAISAITSMPVATGKPAVERPLQIDALAPAWDSVYCAGCREYKPWNNGYGWPSKRLCPTCNAAKSRENQRQRKESDPEAFNAKRRAAYHRTPREREYQREYTRQRRTDPDFVQRAEEARQRWIANNPGKHKESSNRAWRKRRALKKASVCAHGPDCFDAAAKAMPQDCFICHATENIAADHWYPLGMYDSETGEIIGLDCRENCIPLCQPCNSRKANSHPIAWLIRIGRMTESPGVEQHVNDRYIALPTDYLRQVENTETPYAKSIRIASERNPTILAMHAAGVPQKDIATYFGITTPRINQILKKLKATATGELPCQSVNRKGESWTESRTASQN